MSEIFLPLKPRPGEDPQAAGVVQANLEFLMQLFQKGIRDGDTLVWDSVLGRFIAQAAGGVEVLTVLPTTDLKPGKEIVLVDSLSSPTFNWHLRYNADSVSSYKWECIGATPAFAIATGDVGGLTNNTYANTSGGPTITLPTGVGGDFFVAVTGCIVISAAGGDVDRAILSYKVGAGASSDSWGIRVELGITDSEGGTTGQQVYRHTSVAAGAAIVCQDRQEGGTSHRVLGARTLTVTPIRVG
jgi:hypothetical protein